MVKKYTPEDIESMRAECCSYHYDRVNEVGEMCTVLYEGWVGWNNVTEQEVIEYWEENIGEDKG
jgi:hypothetical protein